VSGVSEYLYFWQLPLFAVFTFGWLIGGGYLFQQSLKKNLEVRKLPFSRGVLVSFLSGAAGGLGVAILLKIGLVLFPETPGMGLTVGGILGVPVYALLAWQVVLNMHTKLSTSQTLSVCVVPVGGTMVLGVVIALVCGIPARIQLQSRLDRVELIRQTQGNLQRIFNLIYDINPNSPPPQLQDLLKPPYTNSEKKVEPQHLQCPANPSREIGFLYYPHRLVYPGSPSGTLLACDYANNQDDGIRVVLYTNGNCSPLKEDIFQSLLRKEENASFAEMLGKSKP